MSGATGSGRRNPARGLRPAPWFSQETKDEIVHAGDPEDDALDRLRAAVDRFAELQANPAAAAPAPTPRPAPAPAPRRKYSGRPATCKACGTGNLRRAFQDGKRILIDRETDEPHECMVRTLPAKPSGHGQNPPNPSRASRPGAPRDDRKHEEAQPRKRTSRKIAGWPPRWLTLPSAAHRRAGDGEHAVEWIETLCRNVKDSIAAPSGSLMEFRGWERELLSCLLARGDNGRYIYRRGLIGISRKNGKSSISAGVGLYGLLSDYPGGAQGREVYSCAGDKEQARIVFGTARRMIELEPELSEICRVYKDVIEVPATGSIYRCLSAEAYSKEGLNPTLVLFDEVHVQPNRELWDVMSNAMGARPEPLLIGITTAGVRYDSTGRDSLCYQLYEHGKRVASGETQDPTFFFAWYEPKNPHSDYRDPKVWAEANPGLGDIVNPDDLRALLAITPENEFRTKRLNMWTQTSEAWLPYGAWGRCAEPDKIIPDGAMVVLGFDGSFNQDCTALVAVSVEERPHLQVAGLWENPDDDTWRVPILDVEEAIREACRRWEVVEIACDPYRWARTYQVLEGEGLPVVEFPQSPARMTPATQTYYEAVVNRRLSHPDDTRLNRHMGNTVLKRDSRGIRVTKESTHSKRRIDLAMAGIMGHDRARWHHANPPHEILVAWGEGA